MIDIDLAHSLLSQWANWSGDDGIHRPGNYWWWDQIPAGTRESRSRLADDDMLYRVDARVSAMRRESPDYHRVLRTTYLHGKHHDRDYIERALRVFASDF